MTMLAFPMSREANLPSLEEDSFVVLGDAMGSVVQRVIEARAEFVEGLKCRFWQSVIESEYPEFLDEQPLQVVAIDPSLSRVAAQYSSTSAALKRLGCTSSRSRTGYVTGVVGHPPR